MFYTDYKTREVFEFAEVECGQYIVLSNPEQVKIGKHSRLGDHAVIHGKFEMGEHSIFGSHAVADGNVKIGEWTTVYGNFQSADIVIGSRCFIGPCCTTTNTKRISNGKFGNPRTNNDERFTTIIEDDVIIGASCSIAPGITIKKFVRIDMGCLILKDVPEKQHVRAGTVWK